jgi:hypothetical protein
MVALDLQQDISSPRSGSVVTDKETPNEGSLSFSDLLKGVNQDSDKPQEGVLLLSLDGENEEKTVTKESKSNSLLSLLTGDDTTDLLEINPEVTEKLSSEDLKLLNQNAKNYLKEQILATDGFKRSEVDKLPKTLQGLAQAAEKIGIDISKITIDEVQQQTKTTSKNSFQSSETLQNVQSDLEKREKKDTRSTSESSKSLALFQTKKESTISTEEMVNVKSFQKEKDPVNSKKQNSDETLKLLLQGESSAKKESSGLTTDFSVATAKVIAPTLTTSTNKGQTSLETLLNPNSETTKSDDEKSLKTEGVSVAKADSFEVKLNEAKQMVKYLSQDVKQAIDNYKSPFTRVKVQLNPQELGDIELTVVQRGKDLHVNLSSNNSAINTLAMNANDLKQQLQNNGINNASLNFSDNSQAGNSSYNGQQQQQKHASSEYNYFESEEDNEEIISSLEIVVPNYA